MCRLCAKRVDILSILVYLLQPVCQREVRAFTYKGRAMALNGRFLESPRKEKTQLKIFYWCVPVVFKSLIFWLWAFFFTGTSPSMLELFTQNSDQCRHLQNFWKQRWHPKFVDSNNILTSFIFLIILLRPVSAHCSRASVA